MSLKEAINLENLPNHIAVIMDGNGRWAKQKGKIRSFGHASGVKSVREITESAAELGIKELTLYAFSTENWTRPRKEIETLMELLINTISKETKTLMENNISLNAIGDLKSLPGNCHKKLQQAIAKTKDNNRMVLTLALSYSSRWEITEAVKSIAQDVRDKKLDIDSIDEKLFASRLKTTSDPELLIRTSGEFRISNYLLWQIAYTELYFTDVLWPDFRKENLYEAIVDYQKRERRFGGVSGKKVSREHA
ncbi:MAG: isoprenyl transferase [Bacteroidia bacterium]|nr:isoprenyl transferase [Bacteroidia bacterium]